MLPESYGAIDTVYAPSLPSLDVTQICTHRSPLDVIDTLAVPPLVCVDDAYRLPFDTASENPFRRSINGWKPVDVTVTERFRPPGTKIVNRSPAAVAPVLEEYTQ